MLKFFKKILHGLAQRSAMPPAAETSELDRTDDQAAQEPNDLPAERPLSQLEAGHLLYGWWHRGDAIQERLLAEGYLAPPTLAQKLKKRTVAELKTALSSADLSPKGLKAELIERLIQEAPTVAEEIADRSVLYLVTETGLAAQNALELGDLHLIDQAIDQFCDARIDEALATLAGVGIHKVPVAEQGRTVTDSIFALPQQGLKENIRTLLDAPHDELPYPANLRRRIAAAIAVEYILSNPGIGEMVLRVTGGEFECPNISSYLKSLDGHSSWVGTGVDDTAEHRAFLYSHFWSLRLLTEETWQIIKAPEHPVSFGVELLPGDSSDPCAGNRRSFHAAELHLVPRLPHGWGCRCAYTFTTSSD